MEYFQQFPTILYSFNPEEKDFHSVVNIFARVEMLASVLNNGLVYYPYSVQDTDTIEMIAHKYYGDAKRHWIVMFSNQIVDPYFDFPLSTDALNNNIVLEYGSLANAQSILYEVQQQIMTETNYYGNVNVSYANTTLEEAYTYNFITNQLETITLPSIEFPELQISTTTTTLPDGTVLTVTTTLFAISAYDYLVNQNESKRQIQLLDSQYASAVENQLTNLLSS
jgi:hypothetical protein